MSNLINKYTVLKHYNKTTIIIIIIINVKAKVYVSSFWVNTDWKCRLSMLSLVRLSDIMNPSLYCSC